MYSDIKEIIRTVTPIKVHLTFPTEVEAKAALTALQASINMLKNFDIYWRAMPEIYMERTFEGEVRWCVTARYAIAPTIYNKPRTSILKDSTLVEILRKPNGN